MSIANLRRDRNWDVDSSSELDFKGSSVGHNCFN